MIAGYATTEATRRLSAERPDRHYLEMGATGLLVSAAGFGGYRISSGAAGHAEALQRALAGGVNLVDTSANYADGDSETLIGEVLAATIEAGTIDRDQVVIITKGGYLQGRNYALSQRRKGEGRPFPGLVEIAEALEHCIHPEFLDDQIGRSLARLGLETIDGYLLHNPEYDLQAAHRDGVPLEQAREAYYRRIAAAFRHLETEVARGRIRFYGISSNTFPSAADAADFTALDRVIQAAAEQGDENHLRLIQLPFNLLERGAVLEKNQADGTSVLDVARRQQLGLLVNRPLNAIAGRRMVRLADVEVRQRLDYREIIQRIKALAESETRLWRKLLPDLETIPAGLKVRIRQQGCVAETLKHHWRSFGSLDRWRQARDGIFLPRIQGVIDFLTPLADGNPELADWLTAHETALERAFRAVASIYADAAVTRERKILAALAAADDAWAAPGTLSRKAIRALISTAGVSSVLVGMRQAGYVDDVLAELDAPISQTDRFASWQRLDERLDPLFNQ